MPLGYLGRTPAVIATYTRDLSRALADAFRELVKSHTGKGRYLILVEKENGELTIRTRKLEKNEIVTVLSAPRYDFSVTDDPSQ